MENGSPLTQALDFFLLLLIGMGPKIALVPFLELTEEMDPETKRRTANRMVRIAVSTALLLVALGWLLMRLLHFTPRCGQHRRRHRAAAFGPAYARESRQDRPP